MGYRGSWETSHHAQAMKHATESTVHGDFNDAHYVYGDVATTFYRKDSKFMVRTDGPDGALQDYEAKFTFGRVPARAISSGATGRATSSSHDSLGFKAESGRRAAVVSSPPERDDQGRRPAALDRAAAELELRMR